MRRKEKYLIIFYRNMMHTGVILLFFEIMEKRITSKQRSEIKAMVQLIQYSIFNRLQ